MGSFKRAIGNAVYLSLIAILFLHFSLNLHIFFSQDWLYQLSCFAPSGPISGSAVP
jgi:hypothetical protein